MHQDVSVHTVDCAWTYYKATKYENHVKSFNYPGVCNLNSAQV